MEIIINFIQNLSKDCIDCKGNAGKDRRSWQEE